MDNKTHLGLFPLRIFLFPGEQTTLHLFEPRYLQLSADCINNNESFGTPYQGKTTLSELGSLVKIVQILKKYDNGEMDILIECTNNFKINHSILDMINIVLIFVLSRKTTVTVPKQR